MGSLSASLVYSFMADWTWRDRQTSPSNSPRSGPSAELHLVAGGHTGDQEMRRLLLEASDRFASRA